MTPDEPRAVLVCPGQTATASASLGSLPAGHPLMDRAEELRQGHGLEPLADLDGGAPFDAQRHRRPANAWPLILLGGLLDAGRAAADHRLAAVVGNSLGWCTALVVAGALSFDDGFRLVQELALLAEEPLADSGPGGQVIYPLTDPEWRPDPALGAAVEAALRDGSEPEGAAFHSVELGSHAVLAGDEPGVARLLRVLPPLQVGDRRFPLRVAAVGPYHTPLLAEAAAAAAERLAGLEWRAPSLTLVDGRGARWSPWSTDPVALAAYTLGEQPTTTYRFATSLRVALREHAPDLLVLLGPGTSLGAICGQLIVAEGYRGLRSKAAFEAAQRSAQPVILGMRPSAP